jgi:hypothetical protein
MDVTRPSPGVFGVRGFVTQGSQPVFNATVSASGAGRIKKFLKTTLTSGFNVTTAPIAIASSATISSAAATIEVQNTLGVSLITPNGTALPMALLGGGRFQLTAASAAALVGQEARGNWSFRMSGITLPLPTGTIQLNPSVKSASVELLFTGGISTTTGTDGEFTLEYLNQGIHLLVTEVQGTTVSQAINLVSNRTNINLALAPVGVANMEPKQAFVDALEPLTYSLAYTITEGRNWRDLKSVQLKFRDDEGTVLWVEFDPAQLTLSLVDPDTGRRGPAFAPGHPNRLETSAATVLLANSQVQTGVPNPSSVTLNLAVSFKPQADARVFDVEVITVDKDGISQGPDLVGRLQVGEVTSPKLPDPPEEEIF